MAESLKSLMKNAHIRIAHGQMPTRELEQIMSDFYHAHATGAIAPNQSFVHC
jgi:transcription-repair coupling factor (superfamily II helicase)